MGTNNFCYYNTTKCYAVLLNEPRPVLDENYQETDEIEMYIPDENDYDFLIEDIESLMEDTELKGSTLWDNRENRNYPSKAIATIFEEKEYKNFNVAVSVTAIIRSGYYEGACLDWQLNIDLNGNTIDSEIEPRWLEYDNQGLAKIHCQYINKWINKTSEKLIKIVENIFELVSTPLKCVASFSNGEVIYQKY